MIVWIFKKFLMWTEGNTLTLQVKVYILDTGLKKVILSQDFG